ncbi:MAG: energy transducer TonB [Kofleriaceae bacterium]|nr:energy transducer TonB [Kofleriaceae bacterium]
MTRTTTIIASLALVSPVLAQTPPAPAQPAPTPPAPAPAPPPPAPTDGTFEPPRAKSSTEVPYPAGAPAHDAAITVTVKLLVGIDGLVQKVDLITPPQPPFDEALIATVKAFVFEPARFNGAPVPVEIKFTHHFQPPPPPAPEVPVETGPPRTSKLRGRLVQLGTRMSVASATVTAQVDGRTYVAEADERGRFELPVPPGTIDITVTAPGHNRYIQRETLSAKQELAVTYLVERDRYDPYEIIVTGEERREEVSRITLRGPEIKQVPGTFGDPFRVVQALPGVASAVSLLPFPIVRGASPSSTGFLLDGTRVPLLYHLLAGPSVIHPNFIDEMQFYPGGAPVGYGGYTGGIIDGRTARARRDEHLIDVDVNLLQAGGMVRQPVEALGATVTAAARYGYPGMILGLATNELSLSYWDYQLRVDGGTSKRGWTVFAFGARDTLSTISPTADPADPDPPLEPSLDLGFHRLDLRYHQTIGKLTVVPRVVLGWDRSGGGDQAGVATWLAEPSLRASWKAATSVEVLAGLEGSLRKIDQGERSAESMEAAAVLTAGLGRFTNGAAFVEALYRPTARWLIRPGVRTDVFADGETTKASVDPRLTARFVLARRDLPDVPPTSDDSAVWLKASAGIYHQPPRFILPLPGLDLMPLRFGLLRSYQSSLGAEIPLAKGFQLNTEGFFNYIDPALFDLAVNDASVITAENPTLFPTDIVTTSPGEELVDRLTRPQLGRAYGLELMLRRQAKTGVYGWVSYTLSRSERMRDGEWVPFDFDRSHLVNVVAGLPLPRNWDLGARVQYQSGKPVTTTAGYNTARSNGFVRFDVRVDKRVAWRDWLLDFYVDITNIALLPEEVQPGAVIRYVLPTLGVRGRF